MQLIPCSVCAVVPVFNAGATLSELVERLELTLSQFAEYAIILIDDGSKDTSAELIERLCETGKHVTGILLDGNFGQQSALLCGLRHANADYTVILDDDLEQDPALILTLYGEMEKGYDAVYGPPEILGKGAFRGIGSRLRDRLFDRITDKPSDVRVCSFRMINRKTVERIARADTQFVYISMELFRYTRNVASVDVSYGVSKHSGYSVLRLFRLMINMYVYYAPRTVFKFLRKKGPCYQIKKTIGQAA